MSEGSLGCPSSGADHFLFEACSLIGLQLHQVGEASQATSPRGPLGSAPSALESQVCATMPRFIYFFLYLGSGDKTQVFISGQQALSWLNISLAMFLMLMCEMCTVNYQAQYIIPSVSLY